MEVEFEVITETSVKVHNDSKSPVVVSPKPTEKRFATNPLEERKKLDAIFKEAHERDHSDHIFWTTSRSRTLRLVTERVLFASTVLGVILFVLSELWCYFLSTVLVIFRLEPTSADKQYLNSTKVTSGFLKEILYGATAFTCYSFGSFCLAAASLYALTTFQAPFKSRVCRLLLCILYFMIVILLMVGGPLLAILIRNNRTEIALLQNNEHAAFQRRVTGTLDYYKNGQCKNIANAVSGRNSTDAYEMRTFCDMVFRLEIFLYAMLATGIVPVIALFISCLEILANRKAWKVRTTVPYKERTREQRLADMCAMD